MKQKPKSKHISFGDAVVVEEVAGSGIAPTTSDENMTDESTSEQQISVKFGLIKEKHTYIEDFWGPFIRLPQEQGSGNASLSIQQQSRSGNAEIMIAKVPESENQAQQQQQQTLYRATLFAVHSGVLSEVFSVGNGLFKVLIEGRIMGSNSGTPSLRSGVHCVGSSIDEESSEVDSGSEWQSSQHLHHSKHHH